MKIHKTICVLAIYLILIGSYKPATGQAELVLQGEIAFVGGVHPDTNISIIDLETNVVQIVFPHPGFYPVWSPDGGQLAFVSEYESSYEPGEIFIVDADGGNLQSISDASARDSYPAWSADGQSLAYVRHVTSADKQIVIYSFETNTVSIPDPILNYFEPDLGAISWSPNGAFIAFTSFEHAYDDIFPARILTLELSTGDKTVLSDDPRVTCSPKWSPDGDEIAFWTATDRNDYDLDVIEMDSRETRRLTSIENHTNPHCPIDHEWSPNSHQIIFTNGGNEIYVIDSNGENERNITNHPAIDFNASWSPDGQWIVFMSNRDHLSEQWPTYEIYAAHVETDIVRRLTYDFGMSPAWRPRP
jgi:Tol biopolymer transport system component